MSGPNPLRLTVIDYEAVKAVTRDEKAYAQRLIERMARDEDDRLLLEDVLFGKVQTRPPRGFRGREPRDPSEYKPCGTEARYQYHKRHGEPVDDACRKAASKSRVEGQRRRRAQRKAEAEAKEAA